MLSFVIRDQILVIGRGGHGQFSKNKKNKDISWQNNKTKKEMAAFNNEQYYFLFQIKM